MGYYETNFLITLEDNTKEVITNYEEELSPQEIRDFMKKMKKEGFCGKEIIKIEHILILTDQMIERFYS